MKSKGSNALSATLGLGRFRLCSWLGSFFPATPKLRFQSARGVSSSRKKHASENTTVKRSMRLLNGFVRKLGLMDKAEQKIAEGDSIVHQNLDEALKRYERAAFYRKTGECLLQRVNTSPLRKEAERLDNLAMEEKHIGRNSEALSYFLSALRIRESYFAPACELATSYANIGLVTLELPGTKYPKIAVRMLARAVAFCSASVKSNCKVSRSSESASFLELALMHNNLGRALLRIEKVEEALKHFRLALAATKDQPACPYIQGKNPSYMYPKKARTTAATCYRNIAHALAYLSDSAHQAEALIYYGLALHIHERIDRASLETATSHEDLALFLHEVGDLNAAQQHFQSALNIRESRMEKQPEGEPSKEEKVALINSFNNIALVLRDKGQVSDALGYLNQALAKTNEGGHDNFSHLEVAWILGTIGRLNDEIYLE